MWLLNIILFLAAIISGKIYAADLQCWDVTEGQHYTDLGLNQAPFNDLDSCINHCLSLPQCSIVDIDLATSPKCWVQKKVFEPTRTALKPKKTVTNYMLNRKCKGFLPDVDIKCWTVSPKKHYTDLGLDEVPIKDLFSCLNYCISLPQCGTIDFDTGTKYPCWVQLKTYEVKPSALKTKDSATNYILNRSCLKPQNAFGINKYVQQCWKATKGYHYSGLGLNNNVLDDVSSCSSLCLSLPQCTTFDIDTSTKGKCWVQMKTFAYNENDLKPKASVTNYALDRNCYDRLVKEDLSCWIATPKYHYNEQGLSKTIYNDRGSCFAYCNSLPQCSTFDIDTATDGKCWVQLGYFEATLKALKPKNTVTNYFLDKYCQGLVSSSIDLSCWEVNNRQHYSGPGLNQVAGINDLKGCLKHCLTLPQCRAVDIDSATNPKCWVQKKDFPINRNDLKPKTTVVNFLLKPNCLAKTEISVPAPVVRPKLTKESTMSAVMSCWLTRNDTAYAFPEAMKSVSHKTLKECLLYCYSIPNCKLVNYEWSSSSPCKIMETEKEIEFDNFETQNGVASFVYNKECSSSYTHVQTSGGSSSSHSVTIEYDEA